MQRPVLPRATAPLPDVNADFEIGFSVGISQAGDETPGEAALGKAVTKGIASLTPVERASLESEIGAQPRFIRPLLHALAEDYNGVTRRATEAMPRVLFVLIPGLALVLRLFYRGRHYPEHLYFATHFGAVVFVVLTIETVADFTQSLLVMGIAHLLGAIVIVAYVIAAQRRVYGGSWPVTVAKAFGVAVIYGTMWSAAVLAVTLWASR